MKTPTRKQKIYITTSLVVASILVSTPSYGFVNINNFLGSMLNDIKSEMQRARDLVKVEIDKTWAGIRQDARSAIESSIGSMGSPDPIKSSQELQARLASEYSLPVAREKAKHLERELNRAAISAVMNEAAQEETKKQIEKTAQTAQEAQSLANQAQGMDATQNILKAMAAQNAQIVSMLAQQRTDSLQSRQDTAQSNLMLNQIAEQVSNQNKKSETQRVGLISMNHELIGMLNLDPTYQDNK